MLGASPEALTDKNLYIYCDNNPVMRVDEDGDIWHLLIGAAIGFVSTYIVDVAENIANGKSGFDILNVAIDMDYFAASASGALAASGIGIVGQIAGNALISSTSYLMDQAISNEKVDQNELLKQTVAGGFSGLLGGKGANGAKLYGVAKSAKLHLKTAVAAHNIAHYSAQVRAVPKEIFKGFMSTTLTTGLAKMHERMW